MNIDTTIANGQVRLRLAGRFDFTGHRAFKTAYVSALDEANAPEIVVDFERVDYLDSSALGMLLVLRDRAIEQNRRVVLENGKGVVGDVLRIANFHNLFEIK